MKSRPILFSAPMVRALLAGTKTQTRRLVKPQPPFGCRYLINGANNAALCQSLDNPAVWVPPTPSSVDHRLPCPYGRPGDRLWVKETWRTVRSLDHVKPTALAAGAPIQYDADLWQPGFGLIDPGKTRVSLHLCRHLSRIDLEIAEIRVERLQSISEADAISEGIEQRESSAWKNYLFETAHPKRGKAITDEQHRIMGYVDPRESYRSLWEKINGAGSWALNPWVWVVSFKRVEA
jgi:hypothetical protein